MADILYFAGSIGSLVCFIIVVIRLFKEKGAGLGILGILCGIFTFIWGWMNASRLGIKNIMIAWTACIGLSVLGAVMGPSFLKQAVQPGSYER